MGIDFQSFILIFTRVVSMLFGIPIIGARNVPKGFRIGLAFFTSMILMHIVRVDTSGLSTDLLSLGMAIGGECLIGFTIGLMAKLVFTAVEMAGELMGFQMGFAIVNVIDPQTSSQVPIIGQFQTILATLIFLSINAHHQFLTALAGSFELVPPLHVTLSGELINKMARLTGDMFILAFKIGAPVIVALFITNMAMSIIAKTIPQINILIVGFPLTIAGGLLVMSLSLPLFVYMMQRVFERMGGDMMGVLSVMGR